MSYLVRWLWERTDGSRSQRIGLYSTLGMDTGLNAELDIVTLYVMNDEARLEYDDVSAHVHEPIVQIDRNRNTSSTSCSTVGSISSLSGDDESRFYRRG